MIQRFNVAPANMYRVAGNNQVLYTPVVAVRTGDHVHIYVSGRTSRLLDGSLAGEGDMRAQLRLTCENVGKALEAVGAAFADVVRANTYATDLDAYYRCVDERAKFFTDPLPTSTVVGVTRLAMPGMLVEIEVEAIIEPERLKVEGQ